LIYIIIPVHNRIKYTRDCLLSLDKQTYHNYRIVIIDDGSIDGTSEMLINEFPEVHVIKGDGNLWWTAATNLGVKYALENNADYILTLNNDTIAYEDFLEKMIYWAEKTPNALLGAFALDANTMEPVYGGEIMTWFNAGSKKLLDIIPKNQQKGIHTVTHFPGRGLLIPKAIFENIGYFDENNFPQRSADYDFTLRVCKKGFNIFCNYDAKIIMYPEECGDFHLRQKKNLRKYWKHLFTKKGGGNIKEFIMFALKNSPVYVLPFFLLSGLARRIGGYLIEWFIENKKDNLK